ncbi:MAG: copper amine oxidase N-terminal domain-containing protein [Clostridiales bacterium]|nr:copper amine oxidase N-terminal domain-containing protein [Clostridiales bacterium]
MLKKSNNLFFKAFIFCVLFVSLFLLANTNAFAAGAKLSSSAEKAEKGDTLYSNTLTVTLSKAEINILKDSITLTLNGAVWNDYNDSGNLVSNVDYKKISDTELEIHITPTDKMLENGCSFSVPLKCVITNNQAEISVNVSYGVDGYTDGKYTFAKCSYTRAYLSGSLFERTVGTETYTESTANKSYNNLVISVIASDVMKTRNNITVTLDGMKWSRLKKSGSVANNAYISMTYKKIDDTTILIEQSNITDSMIYSGYTITIPLTGTITGTGEHKAIVDFGCDDIPQSEVVFSYCKDGNVSITSSSYNEVNEAGKVDDIVITDSSTQSFKKNSKFTVTIQQSYSFYQVPIIKGTGKFEGKCSAALSTTNSAQCIITLTDAVSSGETGTIVLSNVIIEKSASTIPRSENITVVAAVSGWEEYSSEAPIAKYSADAEFSVPLRMTSANINAGANEYARLGAVTFTDNDGDRSYRSGDKIVMTFDNDFFWFTDGSPATLKTTGKFQDACVFEFNPDNKTEAYIVFTKSVSSQNVGTIVINNIQLTRDSGGYFPTLNMTAYLERDPATANTIQVGKYSATTVGQLTSTTTTTTTEAAAEATTESPQENGSSVKAEVKFIIGSTSYSVNGIELELNAAPYIKDGYTMLPVRVLANLAGITDDNIEYADGTAVFKFGGVPLLEITAGEPVFTLNGAEADLSTSAEILNGTMFLPMRDLITALGISEENISFDNETKTVTITQG